MTEGENRDTQNGFQARFTWWRDESFLRAFCGAAEMWGRWTRWKLIWDWSWDRGRWKWRGWSCLRWCWVRLLVGWSIVDQWNEKLFVERESCIKGKLTLLELNSRHFGVNVVEVLGVNHTLNAHFWYRTFSVLWNLSCTSSTTLFREYKRNYHQL